MSVASNVVDVRIAGRAQLAQSIISLDLEAIDGSKLDPFEAGSHVDVHISQELVRQYSLCNDPVDSRRYRLGVQLDPNSRGGSAEIYHHFKVGRIIQIGRPRNAFPLVESASHSVLVAGGIGITPILSMAYRLKATKRPFELHYCVRSIKRAAFLDELHERFGSAVRLHCDNQGPVQLSSVLQEAPDGAHLYTCGPEGLMEAVVGAASALGWSPERVHLERFVKQVQESAGEFNVIARQSAVTVRVGSGESIADALRQAGVTVTVSCEQGICGACLTPVLEGTPDHRDTCLTDDERASNSLITPCCSRSLSADLVLDI